MRISHVILDRDGVLNEEGPAGGYVASTSDWHWIPGAREALAMLKQAGIRVSVATNQSGVGRGVLTLGNVEAVHAHMIREASLAAGSIDAVFACVHAPDAGCACRKPAAGLILAAMAASGVEPGRTLVVGDDLRDIQAARAAGTAAALVLTGKGRATIALLQGSIPVYDDLHALARELTAESREGDQRE